ncbi:BrxA/BrxB family bacilliredoxin [Aquibacillus koreensis]|uniref:BrxA/BrxB family bacilliredoxin n=1 Tax=Aquibacillus koreensis TaxID=279446 RepID=A0A9X3WND6_9BACI|nr:BrxA/BrxB family bacilliredoxin [Aquibacillus koreensis]MCT2535968.1 BrxA/BrxB family bacilliredoxin [Aquibacillus koreensis]MDC3420424.1 BrxA/BrxB family bacilliredoxin [Aquibacillus koreensis]
MNPYEQYMKEVSKPMRDELTGAGFTELLTPEEVNEFVSTMEGTSLVVVNSVCGCAAGLARPAARLSLEQDKKPDQLVTVFAGQDREATAKMREFFDGIEPSSPSMALMKNGQVLHFIPREEIEGHEVEEIVNNLITAYNQYC